MVVECLCLCVCVCARLTMLVFKYACVCVCFLRWGFECVPSGSSGGWGGWGWVGASRYDGSSTPCALPCVAPTDPRIPPSAPPFRRATTYTHKRSLPFFFSPSCTSPTLFYLSFRMLRTVKFSVEWFLTSVKTLGFGYQYNIKTDTGITVNWMHIIKSGKIS